MDFLPIIVKKGRPFLESLSDVSCRQRSLSPTGRLVSFLDPEGHVKVHLLSDDEQHVAIDSRRFIGCHWVLPCTSIQECVVEVEQQHKSELLTVSSTFDLYWYAVHEHMVKDGEEKPEGVGGIGGVSVEHLGVLKKSDLSAELRRLECDDLVTSMKPLGSSGGEVLLLINTALVCRVNLDLEFSRISVHSFLSIKPNLGPFRDDALPRSVGEVVDCHFQSPLLFTLCDNGLVFIHSAQTGMCIGVVSTVEYCKMACGRQPESEELLLSLSSSQFRHVAVPPDLNYLVASTQDSHLALVSLLDYFQVFPLHYHPRFLDQFASRRKATKLWIRKSNIPRENEEDRWRYAGLTNRDIAIGEKFVGLYPGNYAWMNRMEQLSQRVDSIQPSEGRYLNLCYSSRLLATLAPPEDDEVRTDAVGLTRKPWYEEPISYSVASQSGGAYHGGFDIQFVTGLTRSIPRVASLENSGAIESPIPNRYAYTNHCILPSAASVFSQNSRVVAIAFNSGVVIAYYRGASPLGNQVLDEAHVGGVAVYRTGPQSFTTTRLSRPSWLIPSINPDQPVYLANSHSLAVATFNLSQEEFISKVLMYGSATVAEEVCYLNRWDKCSLPINALETALELRQLDTVAFFLRSRENEIPEDSLTPGQEIPPDIPSLPPLPPDQLDTAVQLLINAIKKNYEEEHYCQFASQLLIMTLNFLTRMMKNEALREESPPLEIEEVGAGDTLFPSTSRKRTISGTSADTVSMGGLSTYEMAVSLTDLTSYIHSLRGYLPGGSMIEEGKMARVKVDGGVSSGEEHVAEFMDKSLTNTWDKMNPKEVVKDGLLRGCLPLTQAYLMHRKPTETRGRKGRGYGMDSVRQGLTLAEAVDVIGPRPVSERPLFDTTFWNILSIGIGFVLEALEKRGLKLATTLLTQMGMDVKDSLRFICFNTLNRPLRDFLEHELTMQKWLSDSEGQALEYLHILESYYPLHSYDHAQSTHSKQHPRKMVFQSTVLPVVPGIVARPTPIPPVGNLNELFPETFGGDYSLQWEAATSSPAPHGSSTLCLQVPLSAVLQWDSATRQRLLFEGFVLTGQVEGVECERLVNKEHIFDYYISHNNLRSMVQFVMARVPPLEDSTPCPTHILTLCSNMPHAMGYLRDSLLDELSRHGVFLPSELSNLPSLLHRLGRVHSLFTHPHPLAKTLGHTTQEQKKQEDETTGAMVTLEQFHGSFLKYLMENRFISLMYHYLDCYELGLDQASLSFLGLDTSGYLWVDTMIQYRMAARDSTDPNKVFQASLSCSRLLLCCDSTTTLTLMGMLESNKTLMAVATLMFAPVPLEEAMDPSNSHQEWYVDGPTLRSAMAAYPTLQAAIFPPPPTTLTPAQSQDITVYQLLQGNVPFNISRLFKWQETNNLATQDETTEGTHEIPHFSSRSLAEKYAQTEHLTYTYYLQRGQPAFAFANFVAAKLLGHSSTVKRIDLAISRVYRLALRDFTNSRLTSSSAAFVEMVDRDSTLLRVDVQAALRITRYGGQQLQAEQFIQLHGNPENSSLASSLLSQLQTATHNLITTTNFDRCSLEAEECWSLVQSFCYCHHLPPSVSFLTVCAKAGQWLPLLCHSQLYCIPPQKVLSIIEKYFSDHCIQEHLRLAVSSMESGDEVFSPLSPQASPEKSSGKPRRRRTLPVRTRSQGPKGPVALPDLRAKFYSKVGLRRERPHSHHELWSPPAIGGGGGEGNRLTQNERSGVTPEKELPLPPVEKCDLPDDLFSVLFKAQTYSEPWRALLAYAIALQRPLLAILAACYEKASMVSCMCVWLYSTLGFTTLEKATILLGIKGGEPSDEKLKFSPGLQWRKWEDYDLSLILVSAMQHTPSPAAHFTLAFQYFDQDSPLLAFLRFHEDFTLRSNFEACKRHLQELQLSIDRISTLRYWGTIGDTGWMEKLASTMASHMLVMCPTHFERSHLLQLLAETNFGENFQCSVLNFKELHQMSILLNKAGLESDTAFKVREEFSPGAKSLAEVYSVRVRVDSDLVLRLLLGKGQFDVARKYASIVGSTASEVTIKEAEHNLRKLSQSSYWQYEQARLDFWHQCNSSFEAEKVDPVSAAEFFESIVHSSTIEEPSGDTPTHKQTDPYILCSPIQCTATERALLLAFSLKWRRETDTVTAEQLKEFEKEIWLSHIHATIEEMESLDKKTGSSPLPFFPPVDQKVAHSILDTSSILSSLSVSTLSEYKGHRRLGELILPDNVSIGLEGKARRSLSDKESEAFDMMLGRLLNAGFVSQARELAALFEHDSPDLTIVLCCIQLAQGKLTPDQLTEGVLSLVSARSPRQLGGDSTLSFEELREGRPSVEIVRLMHKLSDRAIYAQQCCSCIITCFKIAVALRVPYSSVITTDPIDVLNQLLGSRLAGKYLLAKTFVSTCNIDTKEVAGYLSECVAASLQLHYGGDTRDSPKAHVYSSEMTSNQFMELAQLCPDHTTLGTHLLSMAKSLTLTDHPKLQDLTIQVELLIRAHDSYTLGCCVDGIAEVLVVARQWTNTLVKGKHFKLMVRLLTGIGRFHEMSYVIGLLLEYDEFESLVHTGVEKEEQLRVALMNYLGKHLPDDHEKMQMVALKFGMFRELAKTREEHAKRDLHRIKPKHLVANNPDTVKTLKSVFDSFRTAAKTYAQEDCLSNAEHCYSQARLVALQLSVLQSGKQVINLTGKSVLKFMEEQPFNEALIVADAYKQCIWADWTNPLYKKVVIGGDFRYLHDFKSAFPLAPNMFQELASKYLRDRDKPVPDATLHMKRLLGYLKNLPVKRKLATELGMGDILQTPTQTIDEGFFNDVARL